MKFLETIKVKDGAVCALDFHKARFWETCARFFGTDKIPAFPELRALADFPEKGLWKARIVYGERIYGVQFLPYEFKKISSLRVVEAAPFDYSYKSCERKIFDELSLKKSGCDDIVISVNGAVCDTSYSNLVFEKRGELYTPDTFLLNGTKRRALLCSAKIKEARIKVEDISKYDRAYLINAMIDLEDNISVSVSDII